MWGVFIVLPLLSFFTYSQKLSEKLKKEITNHLSDAQYREELMRKDNSLVHISYFINRELLHQIKTKLLHYDPYYASVVAIEEGSGKVLALIDYDGRREEFFTSLSLAASHPAASIAKVVAMINLLEHEVNPEIKIGYSGRTTTLYRKQIADKPHLEMSIKKSFAISNNPAFARAIIKYSSPQSLGSTAKKVGFNESLCPEIDLGISVFHHAKNQYELAEYASGFNKKNTLSPLHAAVLASIPLNGGKWIYPRLIQDISEGNGKITFKSQMREKRILTPYKNLLLKGAMRNTALQGTARKHFSQHFMVKGHKIEVGGKTGSITGGIPAGKRDWFIAYAKGKPSTPGIALAVMMIHRGLWKIKPAALANKIIKDYFVRN